MATNENRPSPLGVGPPPWYRRGQAVLSACGLAAAALAGLAYWAVAVRPYVSTEDARVAAVLARVAPEGAGGLVVKMDVDVGDRVAAGEPLVELDPREAQAGLERAAAEAALTARDLKSDEKLAAEQGIPRRQLDLARAKAASADAGWALARLAVERCVLRSPFDGVVLDKDTDPGNRLGTGQTAVTVGDPDRAWVAADIEETEAGALRVGQRAAISVDEGGALSGTVEEIGRTTLSTFALIPTENSSGNYVKLVQRIPVKIALDPHPGLALAVGESVEVRVRVRR